MTAKDSCTYIDIEKYGSTAQHCMNCGIGMHRELCGSRCGDIKFDSNIIISCLFQRGLDNSRSETAVIFKKFMRAFRLLNG